MRKNQFLAVFGLLLIIFAVSSQGTVRQSYDDVLKPRINPRSIILMIGDGMGFQHVQLARWIEMGVNGTLNMETLPFHLEVTTWSASSLVTDSAAAATAMATGNKTYNGMLSYLLSGQYLETILELAHARNKSTGVVTTTEVFHATPAAFYSHVRSRDFTTEIVNQLTQQPIVDVIFGGGSDVFSTITLTNMTQDGFIYVTNRTQLENVSSGKVLGIFSSVSVPYEQERNISTTPSLAEMTNKSLEILSQDNDGFFLMVEGGKIDWASHDNNNLNAALEAIEFDRAVGVAKKFIERTQDKNILLLVSADHETGGLAVKKETLNRSLPSSDMTYTQNKTLRIARTNNISVSWSSNGHTGQNVPFYGSGEILSAINQSVIDNTDIFRIMKAHLDSTDLKLFTPDVSPSKTPLLTSSTSTSSSILPSTTVPTPWSSFGVLLPLAIIVLILVNRRTKSFQSK